MAGESITLPIEKLAGLGDGVGHHAGRRVFVPYTLPGEQVRAKITGQTKDAVYAELEAVVTPSRARMPPVCIHFARCGGCAFQHLNDDAYADFKQQTAREAVRKAGFDPACVLPLVRLPPASRRRAELKVEAGRLGYYEQRSHRLTDITQCKVLEPALEALVLRLKPWLVRLAGLQSVQINGVDDGYDMLLTGEGGASWGAASDAALRRISARRGSEFSTLHQAGPVTVTLGGVAVEVPPGTFLQASREAQVIMARQVLEAVGSKARVLDLFAGIGTYSFPLAAHAQVTAVEGERAMVAAMQQAAKRHGLKAFKASARDLFRDPVERFGGYDAVVINPPRTGAKAQAEHLARAEVGVLVMVSCNPATFARDARILMEGGYRLNKVIPVDQFVYSPHLELVAEFLK
jgi:23S rRNA (uracil1939-C5)-methyltransferase